MRELGEEAAAIVAECTGPSRLGCSCVLLREHQRRNDNRMVIHRGCSHDSQNNVLVPHGMNTLVEVLESLGSLHSSTSGMLSIRKTNVRLVLTLK